MDLIKWNYSTPPDVKSEFSIHDELPSLATPNGTFPEFQTCTDLENVGQDANSYRETDYDLGDDVNNCEYTNYGDSLTNEFDYFSEFHGNCLGFMETSNVEKEARKLKRRKIAEPKYWGRNINKDLREKGEPYNGYKSVQIIEEDHVRNVLKPTNPRPARKLKPVCNGHELIGAGGYNCWKVEECDRQSLHDTFWKKLSWNERKIYVLKSIKEFRIKRSRGNPNNSRSSYFKYFVRIGSEEVRVCKEMFMSIYDISAATLYRWMKRYPTVLGGKSPRSIKALAIKKGNTSIQDFVSSLPTMPSHYCRSTSSQNYLEPNIQSLSNLYQIYRGFCSEHNKKKMSFWSLKKYLKVSRISIFQPKKDQCNICFTFKSNRSNEIAHGIHIAKKERARKEKRTDKSLALSGEIHAICVDVQAVQQLPAIQASLTYFKSKLNVHNYTVFDLATRDVQCYWWTETEGDLNASTFATCLIDYMENNFHDDKPIVIFSDGCTSQNRNVILANALLDYAVRKKKPVLQKILEKGHTQMEVDSVHAMIEKKKKQFGDIYVPEDYQRITVTARQNPKPYKSQIMTRSSFKDFSNAKRFRYDSIRPGKKNGDPVVVDIRALKYDPKGLILFKIDYDEDWKFLPCKRKNVGKTRADGSELDQIFLSQKKFKDLQELKQLIPQVFHNFYDNLPHK